MECFSTFILEEEDIIKKMLIICQWCKENNLFFDKAVVLKTEIARLFIEYCGLDEEVDENLILTAMLLCNCKKVDNPQKMGKLETFAKEGADYLKEVGFNKKFCKMCEELNRYSESSPREIESDIIEVVDQFTGLIQRRPERNPFTPEEALVMLEERNLKNKGNRYLELFKRFVNDMEEICIRETIEVPIIKKLAHVCDIEVDPKVFIEVLKDQYKEKIDMAISKKKIGTDHGINKIEDGIKVFTTLPKRINITSENV